MGLEEVEDSVTREVIHYLGLGRRPILALVSIG